jgi:hypothetical protein
LRARVFTGRDIEVKCMKEVDKTMVEKIIIIKITET